MGISGGPYIVRDSGLVLELDAADKNSYAGSGTTWNDLTTNNYIGTLTNGPTFSSTNNGAIVLDGINDYIALPNATSGSAAGSYTWEVWCNPLNLNTVFDPIVRGRDGFGSGWSLFVRISATTGQFNAAVVTTTPSQAQFTATSSIALNNTASAGKWYSLTGTWTAGVKVDLYVNGVLAGTRSTTSTNLRTSTVGWNLGTLDNTSFSTGSIAVARIYNRVLSADEIFQNYEAQKSRFGL